VSPNTRSVTDDSHRAVVYDLDGTLARLRVDWEECARAVVAEYRQAGVDMADADLWTMLEAADAYGIGDRVEGVVADHERAGARRAERLPRAAELRERSVPVGVCSLNCEDACRIALRRHDLLVDVDALVGRDTVPERKPSPAPLLATLDRLDDSLSPTEVLFVGDSDRDEETARRARANFEWAYDDGPTRR